MKPSSNVLIAAAAPGWLIPGVAGFLLAAAGLMAQTPVPAVPAGTAVAAPRDSASADTAADAAADSAGKAEAGDEIFPRAAAAEEEEDEPQPEPLAGGFLIPIEGDVFYEPDLKVLISLPGAPPASMGLLVDGYPVSSPLSLHEEMLSVHLKGLSPGVHELTLLLFNERTEILGRQETRFFIRVPEPVRRVQKGSFRQFGRFVAKTDWKGGEAKGRVLSQSELHFRPGVADSLVVGEDEQPLSQEVEAVTEAAYNVKYEQFQAYGKVLLRTDENRFRQPSHRISSNIKYGPWASLKAGDVYPTYNELVLNGTRVRGAEAGLNLVVGDYYFGNLKAVRGQSRREVPAYIARYDTGGAIPRIDTVPGTFAQQITALRLGLGGGPSFDWGFTALKASDDVDADSANVQLNNLLHGLRPVDNMVLGSDLRIGFWDGRVQLFGDYAASLYTKDASLGALDPDEFDVAFNPKSFEDLIIINASTRGWQYLLKRRNTNQDVDISGFLWVNSAFNAGFVSSIPFSGLVTETEFRYSHLGLEYHSEGNLFLGGNPGDGFTLIQKLLVLDNRLSLGVELGNYDQDLGFTSQVQRNLKLEIRFTPGPYQPSLWIGGGRSNVVPEGSYVHQFESGFLNFNTGAYHQFQLPDGKLHMSMLYGYTQSDLELKSTPLAGDTLPVFPTTRTNIINGTAQYKPRYSTFLPRLSYTFSHNGIQQPTHSVTLGVLESFARNRLKVDVSTTVGQYPENNARNDITLGEGVNLDYNLARGQTMRIKQKWLQYGDRQNLLVGANYELFF